MVDKFFFHKCSRMASGGLQKFHVGGKEKAKLLIFFSSGIIFPCRRTLPTKRYTECCLMVNITVLLQSGYISPMCPDTCEKLLTGSIPGQIHAGNHVICITCKYQADPDRWEVGTSYTHHPTSNTHLYASFTLHFEMLLVHFQPIWALEHHIPYSEGRRGITPLLHFLPIWPLQHHIPNTPLYYTSSRSGYWTPYPRNRRGKRGYPSTTLPVNLGT